MSLAFILLIALAIPALLIFHALATESLDPERKSPAWRNMRSAGRLVGLGQAALFVFGGAAVFVGALLFPENQITGIAFAIYLMLRGVYHGLLWWFAARFDDAGVRTARQIFGFGHLVIAGILVVAAFRETLWALALAGAALWFGIVFLVLPRQIDIR